jgi:hypothetical protein
MHWSRLVDAPMLALLSAGKLLFGPGGGERLVMFVWPLGLFLAFILMALALAKRLGNSEALLPAAVLAVLNIDILTHFIPGRLDHHNVQLVLLLVLLCGLTGDRDDRRGGIVAGLALAAMLAVAMEALPYAVATGLLLPLRWAFDGRNGPDRRLAAFGLSLAAALAILYVTTVPDGGAAYCDAFSAVYLSIGMIGGIGVALLSVAAAGKPPSVRLAGLAGLAGLILALAALVFPDCLRGPYGAVSPELQEGWMDTVAEAQPIWSYAAVFPVGALTSFAAPLLAIAAAAVRVFRESADEATARWRWTCALVFLVTALLVSVYQYRGTPFLNALSIPVLAVWIAEWRARAEAGLGGSLRTLAVLGVWLAGLQVSYLALGNGVTALAKRLSGPPVAASAPAEGPGIWLAEPGATKAERECVDPASAAALAALPEGRVLSPLFFGPTVLTLSSHSALAGPYHRAETAILDTLRVGSGTPDDVRDVIRRHKIGYVVVCPTSREALLMVQEQDSGLFVDLMKGRIFPGMEAVDAPGSYLQIYRVR